MKIVVLGGGGAMAQAILRDLAESTDRDASIGVADVNFDAAARTVSEIGNDKLHAEKCDVTDDSSLKKLLARYDIVINSTWYEFNVRVMRAAIASRVHYLDLGGMYHTTKKQLELDSSARDAGVLCLLGMGSSPGTMNVMAAAGASKMSRIDRIQLRSGSVVIKNPAQGFQPPYSMRTVLDEFTMPPVVFRDGKALEVPALNGKERVTFIDPLGEMEGYYTLHSELATLPHALGKGVREMDFIVAYPPEFTKTVSQLVGLGLASKNPVNINGAEVKPRDILIRLVDSLPKSPGSDLDIDIQRVDLYGEVEGEKAMVRYESVTHPNMRWRIGGGTVDTGVPPSIAAQWIALGKVTERGVKPPEAAIPPDSFFAALGSRDIRVSEHIFKE